MAQRHGARSPTTADETVEVPCPAACECGGEVEPDGVVEQWDQDLRPVAGRTRCYRMHKGRCRRCGWPVRGRHPDQTAQATGAAAFDARAQHRRPGCRAQEGDGVSCSAHRWIRIKA